VTAEFDPKKNALNLRKHGVSLSEGDGVLNDPLAVTIEDPSAEGEQRFVTVGTNTFGSLEHLWLTDGSGLDRSRRRYSAYLSADSRTEGTPEL